MENINLRRGKHPRQLLWQSSSRNLSRDSFSLQGPIHQTRPLFIKSIIMVTQPQSDIIICYWKIYQKSHLIHDSLTHLNNNAFTQPLKLPEIFFHKYKIQSMHRISLIWYSLFHFNTKVDLKTKISHKEQKPCSQTFLPPMLVSCPSLPLLRQITPNFLRTNWNISTFCSNIFNIYALF